MLVVIAVQQKMATENVYCCLALASDLRDTDLRPPIYVTSDLRESDFVQLITLFVFFFCFY